MILATLLTIELLGGKAVPVQDSHGLEVRLVGFYGDYLFPKNTRQLLMNSSYDISSLMRSKRKELLRLLQGLDQVSATPARDYRLLVRSGRDEWLIDAYGRVLYKKRNLQLSPPQLTDLKRLIYESLPPPEEALNWRKEISGKGGPRSTGLR